MKKETKVFNTEKNGKETEFQQNSIHFGSQEKKKHNQYHKKKNY